MIHSCFLFCDFRSRVPCLFWTVKLSAVLQKNLHVLQILQFFQHLLHIWTFSSSDCMILRSIFSHLTYIWRVWFQNAINAIKKKSFFSRKSRALTLEGIEKSIWNVMQNAISAMLFCHVFALFFSNRDKRQSPLSAECDKSAQPTTAHHSTHCIPQWRRFE